MSEKLEPTFIVCEIGKIEGRDFYGIVLKGEIEAVRQAGDLFGEKVTIAACARSASMTDATEALLDELEQGLEGVTPGRWIAFLAYYFGDKPCWAVSSIGLDTDLIAVDLPEELAAHIARCSPENIRAIIDLARQAKKLGAEKEGGTD